MEDDTIVRHAPAEAQHADLSAALPDLYCKAAALGSTADGRSDSPQLSDVLLSEAESLTTCLRQAALANRIAEDNLPAATWMPRVLRLLTVLNVFPPEDANSPHRSLELSAADKTRCLDLLWWCLHMVPETPEPDVSPDGSSGIDIEWASRDLDLMVGFSVRKEDGSVLAWGKHRGKTKPWSGTPEDSEDKIKRALTLLAEESSASQS